ncbi:TIGR02391 family protein [Streptomyces sp. NBC_00053]|uniref:TIGR02391 family protein n=1 Tax=unclassified Streptomyces TaxID=2593676 RepID=UPI00224E8C24|nr:MULTISPECIES: TIGR02391 family protein [unclassified Streptomyces]MCX5501077.1 TIGR02391 family protein [Streptomyces sp. NBC_00052]MCX5550388.1 TIGR02391 family protein [Streptomyces sp. NBC_00051]
MSIDIPWARGEFTQFLTLTEFRRPDPSSSSLVGSRRYNQGQEPDIVASAQVVEQILDRVLPRWRTEVPDDRNKRVNRWCQHREAVQRADTMLQRQAEIRERLGDDAPQLSAATLHPWVWDGARALWRSGHFREAVTAAARKVNAEAQNKVGRRDVSETALFKNVFSKDAPKDGQPRLRLMADDDSDTFYSIHRGAMSFAEGCFAAIRNPNSHEDGLPELPENEALEQLAAFSVLARWVDAATLKTT